MSKITLMEPAKIKSDQDGIKKSLNKLDLSIHNNAVQCLMHAEKHGDTSLMRRLLIDVIDGKTGYRRQGLIQWMRLHSPMELKGDVINLGGTDDRGNKRPFNVDGADETPFWNNPAMREIVKPVFQAGVVASINSGLKKFENAMGNTVNGKPIDASKPFYDGKDADKVEAIVSQIQTLLGQLPPDNTAAIRAVQDEAKRLGVTSLETPNDHSGETEVDEKQVA